MNITTKPKIRSCATTSSAAVCVALMTMGLMLVGCNDHRISLDEFLQMQAGRGEEGNAAAGQPLWEYTVGHGDIVEVAVTPGKGAEIPPVRVRVKSDGTIELPVVGKIKVIGMTLEQAETAVQKAYLSGQYDQAIVLMTAADPRVRQPSAVFVHGLVNAPGVQEHADNTRMTVLQALAAASGLRMDLFPSEATLIRNIDGKDVHVRLNLRRMRKGLDQNITLAAGDILSVPHTTGTRVHEFINETVHLGATASVGTTYTVTGSERHGDDAGVDTIIAR